MLRANDVMTRAVASVDPEAAVSQAAKLMRDLDIGDILVIQEGKLKGIVTDRDLTVNVLTNGADTNAPVGKYMTTDVVTGAPDWSLEQIAKTMGEHQIRRLPIVEEDTVVGIVSLGDVALHTSKRAAVAESLKNISDVTRARINGATPLAKAIGLALPVAFAVGFWYFANSKAGKRVRTQWSQNEIAGQAVQTVSDAVRTLADPNTRQAALRALEASGLPEKTRQAFTEAVRTVQAPETRDRVLNFATHAR